MKSFHDLIVQIYPQNVQQIENDLFGDIPNQLHGIPPLGNWYKEFNLFVTYPDTFKSENRADINTLISKLDYLSAFGITALHVLPPFQSPMIDGGFDISDYYTIREELGGNEAFDKLIEKTHALGIHLFLDLVCNHVSQEHVWFQKALAGEEHFQDFFIHSHEKPQFIKKYSDSSGLWARYFIEGEEKDIRLIFSDQAGEIPHWVQGGDSCWYYHTFYPHQIDMEWNNPNVFIEFGKILKYWSKRGLNFRLDAIPFVGKDISKGITESTEKTHLIVQALHLLMKGVSPESVFLVESCQPLEITKKYFGEPENTESDLAYNFHLMTAMWSTLITQDPFHLWQSLKETKDLPNWGQWITFLRNHDDLTLEFPVEEIRFLLLNTLKDQGLVCKEGFGIGGQTIELLNNDPRRFIMAYTLLASLPGCPAVICGDEIGRPNDFEYMRGQTQIKQERFKDQLILDDVRDINRGYTTDQEANDSQSKEIYRLLSTVFLTRLKFKELSTSYPKYEPCNIPSVMSMRYALPDFDIVMFINLRDESFTVSCPSSGEKILSVNYANLIGTKVTLHSYGAIWIRQAKLAA